MTDLTEPLYGLSPLDWLLWEIEGRPTYWPVHRELQEVEIIA